MQMYATKERCTTIKTKQIIYAEPYTNYTSIII